VIAAGQFDATGAARMPPQFAWNLSAAPTGKAQGQFQLTVTGQQTGVSYLISGNPIVQAGDPPFTFEVLSSTVPIIIQVRPASAPFMARGFSVQVSHFGTLAGLP
jgi:hypothetical protein